MGNIFIAALPYQAPVVRLSLRGLLKIWAEPGALSREGIGCHCNKWIPQCLQGKWKRFSLSGSEQPGVTVASPGCHLQPISLYKGWWIRAGGGGKASTETEDEGHKNDEANSIGALIGDGSREGGHKEEPEVLQGPFHVLAICVFTVSDAEELFGLRWRSLVLLKDHWQLKE